MRHAGLTDRAKRTICARHHQGEGYRRIAHDFGVHWLTVKYHVTREAPMAARHTNNERLGPQVRQLSLDLADLGRASKRGHTPRHHARHAREAARQLARCERELAKLKAREGVPRWRRCEICEGLEDTTQPHEHRRAA